MERSNQANHAPLSPLTFLYRTAGVFGERASLIHGSRIFTWSFTLERCRRLASAISASLHIAPGQVVSVVAPNIPAHYEMHFGVPMAGAILNSINIRLDAPTIAVLFRHAHTKAVFVDTEFYPLVSAALRHLSSTTLELPTVVLINDQGDQRYVNTKLLDYEHLLASSSPDFPLTVPNEEDSITLNYTSGTTSSPKGVLYTHRGAYLNSLASVLLWGMKPGPIYLWTLPMFHCNGWCFTWAVAAQAGTNVCMRHMTAKSTFQAIAGNSVTHLCGAPTVLNMIANAGPEEREPLKETVNAFIGGAAPTPALLARMEELGFAIMHGYGLTETYGPALCCEWKPEWDRLPLQQRASLKSRQGVRHLGLFEADVKDPVTMASVPRDGKTIGEIMVRGSTVMKGYLKDEEGTRKAFEGGWFHTGDLGVHHPDGYVQVKDRSKDIIISGGENISSLEVESVLSSHPEVLEAAVVARPDEHWGETPCAFVTLKESWGGGLGAEDIISFCRERMPHFMCPQTVVFGDLPKTATGKVQKFVLKEKARQMGSRSRL